jgi:phage terminase large subunit-like protein
MVRLTVATADKLAGFKEASASRGEVVRAEPIAAFWEQQGVARRHVRRP